MNPDIVIVKNAPLKGKEVEQLRQESGGRLVRLV